MRSGRAPYIGCKTGSIGHRQAETFAAQRTSLLGSTLPNRMEAYWNPKYLITNTNHWVEKSLQCHKAAGNY